MLDYLSDKLPQELLRPKSEWRPSATGLHIMGAVNNFNLEPRQIPVTHLRKICFTMSAENHGPDLSRGIPLCKEDDAVYPWFSHFCLSCGEFFIRDFVDTRFCAFYAHCWNCLPKLPWDYCADHYGLPPEKKHTILSPLGMNPKKYTDEEIADAFAFLND